MIQCQGVPVPEVGSQPSMTANTRMPVIATQKSGALAPASEITLAMRSNAPPGRYAASAPTTTARPSAAAMVIAGELERGRKRLQHDLERRPRLADRDAEIEAGEIREEPAELLQQRVVEAVLLGELGARLERGIERQIEVGRIAGQPREEEDQDDQPGERDEARQRPPGEILPQRRSPGPRYAWGGCAAA